LEDFPVQIASPHSPDAKSARFRTARCALLNSADTILLARIPQKTFLKKDRRAQNISRWGFV
jgi:hypothetical protein